MTTETLTRTPSPQFAIIDGGQAGGGLICDFVSPLGDLGGDINPPDLSAAGVLSPIEGRTSVSGMGELIPASGVVFSYTDKIIFNPLNQVVRDDAEAEDDKGNGGGEKGDDEGFHEEIEETWPVRDGGESSSDSSGGWSYPGC